MTVCYVSDHWDEYVSLTGADGSASRSMSLEKLQLEYDHFFLRAVLHVLRNKRWEISLGFYFDYKNNTNVNHLWSFFQVGYLVVYVWDAVWNSLQLHAVEGPLLHAVCRDNWTGSFEQHMWCTLLHYESSRYQCLFFKYLFHILWNPAWCFCHPLLRPKRDICC